MTTLEKVALALETNFAGHHLQSRGRKAYCMMLARAAIAAMCEPTDANDPPEHIPTDKAMITRTRDASGGWHVYYGRSRFLIAEGSAWSSRFGALVYFCASVWYWWEE
jgi:hypothetical protein